MNDISRKDCIRCKHCKFNNNMRVCICSISGNVLANYADYTPLWEMTCDSFESLYSK